MANHIRQQSLPWGLAPFGEVKVYIANSWSLLPESERQETDQVLERLDRLLQSSGFVTFVAMREHPPSVRQGREAEKLAVALRKEMALSHLLLLIYNGPSQGIWKELSNAEEFSVPALILTKEGHRFYEMGWSTTLRCLGRLTYHTPEDAEGQVQQFLKAQHVDIARNAFGLEASIKAGQNISVGITIRYLREGRGWTQTDLADRTMLSRSVIQAIELNVMGFIPNLRHLIVISQALDVSLGRLFQSAEEWQDRITGALVAEVACEEGWSLEAFREFSRGGWREHRTAWRIEPSKEDICREMRLWWSLWQDAEKG